MALCRACGQGHSTNQSPLEAFQNHASIYFGLTSIQLHDHEDPSQLMLCSDCVDKLNEFDRFRDVCLQVHYGLQVKTEPQYDLLTQEAGANEPANSTDDEMVGDGAPSELEFDDLTFEEVNIDTQQWSELKPDPDPDLIIDASCESPSLSSIVEELNSSSASEYATTTSSAEAHYLSASELEELLKSSAIGRRILERASYGPLSKESQHELVSIIVDRHYELRLPAMEEILRQYAAAITALFQHESQDTYFVARGGFRKNPGGKLFNRISNVRKKKAAYEQFVESDIPMKTQTTTSLESTSAPSSTGSHFMSATRLKDLLQSTPTGRAILERAPLGPLSKDSQSELVYIIVEWHFARKFPAKQEVLVQYANAVTELFKYECKQTYFIDRGGARRTIGGRIYTRIANMRQKAAKRKLNEECHLKALSQSASPSPSASKKVAVAKNAAIGWLELNSKPWPTALEKWTTSFAARKDQLANAKSGPKLLSRYKHLYKEELGYQLVDIDFRLLAIGDSEGLQKWNAVLPTLVTHLFRPYQDDLSKAIAEHLRTPDLDQDSMICGVLMLLNNELQPTKVKQTFKPSILVAQRDVILFAETEEEVTAKLNESQTMYESYDLPIVPQLVFRGKSFRELIGTFEVHYKDIVYRLDSAARAVDVLVKLNTVLGLEYSRICRLLWKFICSFIYDLPVAEQYESINKLKRLLEPCIPVC